MQQNHEYLEIIHGDKNHEYMEIMNGEIFVTVFSNINIWEHQIKLTVELSGTTYFEFQEAPKASESNLKLTEINRKQSH